MRSSGRCKTDAPDVLPVRTPGRALHGEHREGMHRAAGAEVFEDLPHFGAAERKGGELVEGDPPGLEGVLVGEGARWRIVEWAEIGRAHV